MHPPKPVVTKTVPFTIRLADGSFLTRAYREYDIDQLARVHALTYVVYREILQNMGSNQYDMPHTRIV